MSETPTSPQYLQADPDGLVDKLRSYDRSKIVVHPNEWKDEGWDGKRGGKVNMVTKPPITLPRIMKDLHGSRNILEEGYIITEVREIKEPQPDVDPEDRTSFSEREDVYRIVMEPVGKFLNFAQNGYYCSVTDQWLDGAPTRA